MIINNYPSLLTLACAVKMAANLGIDILPENIKPFVESRIFSNLPKPRALIALRHLSILLGACFALTRLGLSGKTSLAAIAIPVSIALYYVHQHLPNNEECSSAPDREGSWANQCFSEQCGYSFTALSNFPY